MTDFPQPLTADPATATGARGADGARRDRALFAHFLKREITTRYLGSATGLAWALLHPLALLAVYHFVFTLVFRLGRYDGASFLLFVAVALWPWLAAQEGLQRATVSLIGHAGLIRKVAFPQELVVYASVAATLLLQFAGYLAVLVALAALGEPVRFEGLLVAVPLWLILALAVTGLALLLAALQVFIRDVEHVLMPLLMIMMYLTPILYPLTLVPEGVRPWVAANPFGWLVTRLREALLEGVLVPRWSDAVALAAALALYFAGRWVFRRLAPHFEDFL
jgi:ABC-type polysaccharide/polyol phosphate export permease